MAKPTPRKQEWKDEYTLLCERCGYIIEDLDQSLPCPECGEPITESLPQRRVGTPFQQNPSNRNLLKTWLKTIKSPRHTLDTMSLRTPDLEHYSVKPNFKIAAIFILFGSILVSMFGESIFMGAVIFPFYMVFASALILIFFILTKIESKGLQVIGKSRGFRITPEIANSIVAQGSVGWTIVLTGLAIFLNAELIDKIAMKSESNLLQDAGSIIFAFGVFSLGCSLIFGFLFFEYFAYLGLRRCKYANRSRPESTLPSTPKP